MVTLRAHIVEAFGGADRCLLAASRCCSTFATMPIALFRPPPSRATRTSRSSCIRREIPMRSRASTATRSCRHRRAVARGPAKDAIALHVNAVAGKELTPTVVSREWDARGKHRTGTDMHFDSAVIHASDSLTVNTMIALMDATYTPLRDFAFQHKIERVPAFDVSLAVRERTTTNDSSATPKAAPKLAGCVTIEQ
jgi:hypothetical protein